MAKIIQLRIRNSVVAVVIASTAACTPGPVWPGITWPTSTPEDQGMASSFFETLDRDITAGTYGNIDRVVVIRNGYLVVSERYSNDYAELSRGHEGALGCGIDMCADSSASHEYNYYHPSTHPYYQGRDVHSLQSVTKSVSSAVIGMAIGQGEIASLDTPLLSLLEDYDLSGVDERLHQATLEDLLTMRSGIEWHEGDRPLDETNTTVQLEASADWVQFTLDQPMDADPGQKWVYNSGGSHLMSALVKQATGEYIDEYAQAHLFGPLDIPDFHWKKTPKGLPDTEGGLYLEAEQLAKIGYLYLSQGVWNGQRIVPESYVRASVAQQVESVTPQGWGYGYQWWRLDEEGHAVWAGLGFGGQYLLVIPEYQLIGVVNSWNVFGGTPAPILPAFLDALLQSVRE